MTEGAVERAAYLARYAQSAAHLVGNEHHFKFVPVGGLEQPFARAVGRMLSLDHLGPRDDEAFGQPRAHGLGYIGHRREFGFAAMVDPVEHLLGAQFGLFRVESGLAEQIHDLALGEAEQVDTAIGARRDVTRDGNGVDLPRNGHEIGGGHRRARYREGGGVWLAPPQSGQRRRAQPTVAASMAVAAPVRS